MFLVKDVRVTLSFFSHEPQQLYTTGIIKTFFFFFPEEETKNPLLMSTV